jgi:hypothetical protein
MVYLMANPKSAMFERISQLSKNAPLHEAGSSAPAEQQPVAAEAVRPAEPEKQIENESGPRRKAKAVRRAKNVQIPEDLWDAYDSLKERNVTSLLMTPYILEAFREKLARDGAFDSK